MIDLNGATIVAVFLACVVVVFCLYSIERTICRQSDRIIDAINAALKKKDGEHD